MKLSYYGGIYADISRGMALVVASEYTNTHYLLNRSSSLLMSLDSWPKKLRQKLDTRTDPFIGHYGSKIRVFDGLLILEFRAIITNKSSKDQ